MSMMVGIKPNEVFAGTDTAVGKVAVGTRGLGHDGKEYIFCLVAASQNLVSGNLCTIQSTGTGAAAFTATILATGAPAPGASGIPIGVCVSSITASASTYIWLQTYGSCNVTITDATASNLPGHILVPASASGAVRGAIATASSFLGGITLSATASTGSTGAAFLNYPRLAPA